MNNNLSSAEAHRHLTTGAESLLATLEANRVDVCFANPGTSEMHFVSALDRSKRMRAVLGLFEGVVTGAADGYARITGRPAATLLHLGPGMANGLSNLHNAVRAQSPIVNVIGDHATYHRRLDAPLTSDIEGAARPFSDWVRTIRSAETVGLDTAEAIRVAHEGKVSSLILPADAAWNTIKDGQPAAVKMKPATSGSPFKCDAVEAAAQCLEKYGKRTAILLGSRSVTAKTLAVADAIAKATGAQVLLSTSIAVLPRGEGTHSANPIPYSVSAAQQVLKNFENIILVGARPPVAFFAYPDMASQLYDPFTRFVELVDSFIHAEEALELVRETLGGASDTVADKFKPTTFPTGKITPVKLGGFLSHSLPEGAIVVDESMTTGPSFFADTRLARYHHWIMGTGGSIGYAMATSIGAAIAAPDRPVITLESDGSGMYMPQALWTQAREKLNITTLIFANRKYEILRQEMVNVGVPEFGDKAEGLMDLSDPVIDWVGLAESMNVPGWRVQTFEELYEAFSLALRGTGPHLIEVVL